MKTIVYLTILFWGCHVALNAQNNYPIIDKYISDYQFDRALIAIDAEVQTKELQEKKSICYKGLDNYSKAIEVLLPLAQEFPDDLKIKSEIALCYQALSNWSASLNYYDVLIKLDPVNVYYKIKRAEMLFRLDNYKEALIDYKTLSEEYKLSNMIKRSAQCFENMNELDSAVYYYTKALEADTLDVFSTASLININIKQKSFGAAMKLSDSFVEKDSTNRQINLLNGLSYYGADLYEDAVSRFERCYLNGDSSLVVNRSLGISYYSLGENDAALPFLQKAYIQDSTNARVLYCLAVISNEVKNYADAAKYFETLLDRTIPPDMYLYLYFRGLAKAYEGLEGYKEAVENYAKAVEYGTKNQDMYLYFSLATIYDYELRQADKALEYYLKYQSSLGNYLEELKERNDQDERDKHEILRMETGIKALDLQIERLEVELAKKTTDAK